MNKKAFTLIELIVVIAIIAILALILVPQVTGYIQSTQETVCNENFRQIETDYLLQNVLDDETTLTSVLNQYRNTDNAASNNRICPLCDNITVNEINGNTYILTCDDNSNFIIDNSTLIINGFMDNVNHCLATKDGNFSEECIENYIGRANYLGDSYMRNLLLEDFGGTWPEFNAEIQNQINSFLAGSGETFQFEGQFYMQTKFIAPENNEINYFTFLASDDTGHNAWKTKLIYDPVQDKYYATKDGSNFNVAPYYISSTSYDEFLEVLNSETFIEIELD